MGDVLTISENNYQLADRYQKVEGHFFLTGIQALARLPIQQLRVDRSAGLNTAAFVSGYPGSPIGGYDSEIEKALKTVPDFHIVHQPGVNEELSATSVMGSQLAVRQSDCQYDGILGLWYGKAPGLDRASDALRHAVFAGTSTHGGAVALVGDDPAAKSSTLPSTSDAALVDLHMPIFYPGDVQEVLDLGMHAIALSRITGLWTAMKIVTAVADGSGTVDVASNRVVPIIPDLTINGAPYRHEPNGFLITPYSLEIEQEFHEVRHKLAKRYLLANSLNRVTAGKPDAWIGLISSGFTYHELLHALNRLGLSSMSEIENVGIRLLQMQAPVSFDQKTIQDFAQGLDEILVVEEKNPTLEWLVKDALYGSANQPRVIGKTHPDGRELMPSYGILDSDTILPGLRERLASRIEDRLAPLIQEPKEKIQIPVSATHSPYFCSGCPHNWGTKVPEGTLVGSGIGCHGMNMLMEPTRAGDIASVGAMGNEGAQWIGITPFVDRSHFIQNIGDGTFFHSGQLAIQAAVAAGVSITYKLLYNGAVAMTGGQTAQGGLGTAELSTIFLAQGVKKVLITTPDLTSYETVDLPSSVEVWDRTRIVEAQEMLAAVEGVTVLIHDQACAAQTRRLRKRDLVATPKFRVAINPRICEGCGDCGEVSNCLSVQAIETKFGTKTAIDQSSCNLDFSCLNGDCPAFMSIAISDDKENKKSLLETPENLPEPSPLWNTEDHIDIRLAGIGGTGVVTVSQILATAAMLDGFEVRGLDQTGLSQKAGAVISDVRLSRSNPRVSNLVGERGADVVLAFNLLVGAGSHVMHVANPDRTIMVGSTSAVPTGSMVGHPETALPEIGSLISTVDTRTRPEFNRFVDSVSISEEIFGTSAPANIFLLGVAVQSGVVPVSPSSINEAIELNGVAVNMNQMAFAWGRNWVVDPSAPQYCPEVKTEKDFGVTSLPSGLDALVERLDQVTGLRSTIQLLVSDLVSYQNVKYASSFLELIESVALAEQKISKGSNRLTESAARSLHKLMAYKDEYEVARLLIGPEGEAVAHQVGNEDSLISWHLHPPVLSGMGVTKKWKLPASLGKPLMLLLSKGKVLRGTRFDLFGYTDVRRLERELVSEYQRTLHLIVENLSQNNFEECVAISKLALDVRGFEALKLERGKACLDALSKVERLIS